MFVFVFSGPPRGSPPWLITVWESNRTLPASQSLVRGCLVPMHLQLPIADALAEKSCLGLLAQVLLPLLY